MTQEGKGKGQAERLQRAVRMTEKVTVKSSSFHIMAIEREPAASSSRVPYDLALASRSARIFSPLALAESKLPTM